MTPQTVQLPHGLVLVGIPATRTLTEVSLVHGEQRLHVDKLDLAKNGAASLLRGELVRVAVAAGVVPDLPPEPTPWRERPEIAKVEGKFTKTLGQLVQDEEQARVAGDEKGARAIRSKRREGERRWAQRVEAAKAAEERERKARADALAPLVAAVKAGLLQLADLVEGERAVEREQAAKKKTDDHAQGRAIEFEDPELWGEEVDGAELLDELSATFSRFLVLPEGAAEVLALWTTHTHLAERFEHTPYLAVVSPTKRCAKTTALTVAAALARRPVSAGSMSAASVFRVVERWRPTLFIDELDRVPRDSELWCVLNTGHARGGTVMKTVGDDYEPRAFSTFCPKALAYIRPARSPVPDALEDRSLRVALQRKRKNEPREKLRTRVLEALARPLRRRLWRWAQDNGETLGLARPEIPLELDDRAADSWEPLLAVADTAGKRWPDLARQLAAKFSADRGEEETAADASVLLLTDLGGLLDSGELRADEHGLSAEAMVRLLRDLDDHPWRKWGRSGDGLTAHTLGRLLRPYGLRSELVGPERARVRRYAEQALRDACARFSPEHFRTKRTSAQPSETDPASDSAATTERMSASEAFSGDAKGSIERSAVGFEEGTVLAEAPEGEDL